MIFVIDNTENESDSESDGEFEEVKDYKEGYEAHIPEHLREEYGLTEKAVKPATNPDWVMPCLSEMDDNDPTTAMPTIRKLKQQMQYEETYLYILVYVYMSVQATSHQVLCHHP